MSSISVVVPIYNAESTLERCLDSIKNQSFPDFEALLVDDGSSDNSRSICESYCKSDARFKLITQQNSGPSAARNKAIDVACSKYLSFIDADDYYEHNALEIFYKNAEASNADLTICSYFTDNLNGSTQTAGSRYPSGVYAEEKSRAMAVESLDIWSSSFPPYSWLHFVKRDCLENPNIRFNPKVFRSEDYLFWAQVRFRTRRICLLNDKYLYHYTDTKGSITHSYIKNYWDSVLLLYDELKLSLPQETSVLNNLNRMLIQRSFVAFNIAAKAPALKMFSRDFFKIVNNKTLKKTVSATSYTEFSKKHRKFLFLLKKRLILVLYAVYLRKFCKFSHSPGTYR